MEYPISEIFYSVQGEGSQSGTPMVFVRLAGCTVGKAYTSEYKKQHGLEIFQNCCKIYDGREFSCDTDYRAKMKLSVEEIIVKIKEANPTCKWVSITGGEPLMHNLFPLVHMLHLGDYKIHLETSGTIPLSDSFKHVGMFDYIVVSPKFPFIDEYLDYIDEVRLLVDENFDWNNVPESIRNNAADEFILVYISPVNTCNSIDMKNAEKCVQLVKDHPYLKISLQIHKLLGVR